MEYSSHSESRIKVQEMKSRIGMCALVLLALTFTITSGGCNTAGIATVVIAASDSSEKSKAQADYLCDGTDDQEEIQAGFDALPSVGGEIVLLEGNYYKDTAEAISIPSHVKISLSAGAVINQQSAGGNEIVFTNSDPTNGNSHIEIAGGKITGTITYAIYFNNVDIASINNMDLTAGKTEVKVAIKAVNTSNLEINGNYIHDCWHGFYTSDSHYGIITNNKFHNCLFNAGEISIWPGEGGPSSYFVVSNNLVESCKYGLELAYASHCSMVSNIIRDCEEWGLIVTSQAGTGSIIASNNVIVGNTVEGCKVGIEVLSTYGTVIESNSIHNTSWHGIEVSNSKLCIIASNSILEVAGQGVDISASEDCLIDGNILSDCSKGNHDVFNGIAVTGTKCSILNNIIRKGEAADAWAGIRIRAGSEDCIVRGNDLRDSGTTHPLYDEGTNTLALLNVLD